MRRDETGAAAVEFALLLLPLCALLLGIMEFGYLLYLNGSAAGAAREGARVFAITQDAESGRKAARDAFRDTTSFDAVATPGGACTKDGSAIMQLHYKYDAITGFFGAEFTATGIGEMRCGG